MPDTPYTPTPTEARLWYYAKHLGTRLGAALGTAYYVWSTAPPKTSDDWVLFGLVMALSLLGLGYSVQGTNRVAQ